MSSIDLLVTNGVLVTSSGRRRGNIAVSDGKIVHIGDE
ncbi:MAG: hypothetical protein QOE62_4118, partial [Actinomycetota bacterium]|nr:hypothetical protein [Actinomycetota bacterium]